MKIRLRKDEPRKYRLRVNDWTPALHPRDPDTGKFVERPYDVPDDIVDAPTQQILGDLWAEDPDFAENLDEIAVDMGDIGPQTVDAIIDRAQNGAVTSGVQAQQRAIYEESDLDMSFREFRERVSELRKDLPLDAEGAALAVVNENA